MEGPLQPWSGPSHVSALAFRQGLAQRGPATADSWAGYRGMRMRIFGALLVAALLASAAPAVAAGDLARLKSEAAQVSIVRDDWGIAHVHGKTDAQAVFGMVYAQAEDDFN